MGAREKGAGLAGLAGCWFSAPRTAPRLLFASTAGRKEETRHPPWPSVVESGFSSHLQTPHLHWYLAKDSNRTEPHCLCAPLSTLITSCLLLLCFFLSFFFLALPTKQVFVIMLNRGSHLPVRDWTLL